MSFQVRVNSLVARKVNQQQNGVWRRYRDNVGMRLATPTDPNQQRRECTQGWMISGRWREEVRKGEELCFGDMGAAAWTGLESQTPSQHCPRPCGRGKGE